MANLTFDNHVFFCWWLTAMSGVHVPVSPACGQTEVVFFSAAGGDTFGQHDPQLYAEVSEKGDTVCLDEIIDVWHMLDKATGRGFVMCGVSQEVPKMYVEYRASPVSGLL